MTAAGRWAAAEALAGQVREAIDARRVMRRYDAQDEANAADLADLLALLRDALDGMERHGHVWPCPDHAAWERQATAAEASLVRLAALYGVGVTA